MDRRVQVSTTSVCLYTCAVPRTVLRLSSSSSTRSRAAVLVSASSNSVPTSNTLSRYAWIWTCSLSLSVCFSLYGGLRRDRLLVDVAGWLFCTCLLSLAEIWSCDCVTSRCSSRLSLVKSYCRWTLKFMSSTEWTTMLMNCIQATWQPPSPWQQHIHLAIMFKPADVIQYLQVSFIHVQVSHTQNDLYCCK